MRAISTLLTCAICVAAVAPEPWLPLNGGAWSGAPAPASPDPLVTYQWPLGPGSPVNDTLLQLFVTPATSVGPAPGTPPASFLNVTSAIGNVDCSITVQGNGTIIIDFGVELAAWLEFDSPDLLDADVAGIQLGISEYTAIDWVGGFKQARPTVYPSPSGCGKGVACTYRLETNNELYEGVRFGFIVLAAPLSRPFTITRLAAICQAKPVNYTGSFSSPGDPVLEGVWYTAAYTVRATLQSTYMGSILMDRGDRFSWTGDAHPSQATAMAAFTNYDFVFNNLNRSKADCQGIATYCLYFVLSVADYYRETGDAFAVSYLTPNVQSHLDDARNMWADPQGLRFVGWDDRTGSGFANNTTPETQALYRLLAIRAFAEAGAFFNNTGNMALAQLYSSCAANFTASIRAMLGPSGEPWYAPLGLHAGSDAVNAGFLNVTEAAFIAGGAISDIVKLPSQSNFNQYFILQALSGLGQLDRGAESVRAIWGPILSLGATTFWETSHPSAASLFPPGPPPPPAEQSGWVSYCHPWSSGPVPWLSKWILGVRPIVAGYGRVLIAPHVACSMSGVAGSVGTPHGTVKVEATRGVEGRAGARLHLTLPQGVREGIVRLSSVLLTRLGLNLTAGSDVAQGLLRSLARLDVRVQAHTDMPHGGFVPADASPFVLVPHAVVQALDAPLLDEGDVHGGRAHAIELTIPGGRSHTLHITQKAGTTSLLPAQPLEHWRPLASPFPPPLWPGTYIGSDTLTQGSWIGKYGSDGYVLIAFDVAPITTDPFCGSQSEGNSLQMQCSDLGATINSILFASFGTATGTCPAFANGTCNAPSSMSVVSAACIGKTSCSIDVDDATFGPDPCVGVPKTLQVLARCTTGGGFQPGAVSPPKDRILLPPYVTFARVVDYDGFCGASFSWTNGTTDLAALQDPSGPSSLPRHLGFTQPCGCPTSPVDIVLTDAAKQAGKKYRLSLYFVDYAPSPSCSGLDGTARSQETYILTGYPDLSPATERQALSDFEDGVWLTYELTGDVRVRISTMRGDMAVLSALAFDPAEGPRPSTL